MEHARKEFDRIWAEAERALAMRHEIMQLRKRLSDDARARLNEIIKVEWAQIGDNYVMDIDEILHKAVFTSGGYGRQELYAEALRPLIAAWERDNGPGTKWFGDAGNSPMVEFLIAELGRHEKARSWATAASVRTLLRHIGR
jgi:hypothetical protein